MRIPLITANWKMNTTLNEAIELVKSMMTDLEAIKDVDKVLCPPYISLHVVSALVHNSSIKVGAQNVYFQEKGAYTGEISPLMLRDLCQYVIVGHSERRQLFNETDDMLNRKIIAALDAGLLPIFCIGESLETRENNNTDAFIGSQIINGLKGIKPVSSMILAYEPVWAIGTGKAATADMAQKTCKFIRGTIADIWDSNIANKIRILYGGSVTPDNTTELISQPDIDGGLVGGASLKANDFISIVKKAAAV